MLRRFLGYCIGLNDFVRGRVYAGLLYLAPLVLTLGILAWIYTTVSGSLEPLFVRESARYLPLVTIGILLLGPFGVGFLLLFQPIKRALKLADSGAERVPFAGSIYRVGKNVSAAFDPETQLGFNRVVHIQYPRDGVWSLGFLTGIINGDDNTRWAVVFLPTAPLPNSGWIAYVPVTDVYELDMTTSEAMQITLSGGIVVPESIKRRRLSDTSN